MYDLADISMLSSLKTGLMQLLFIKPEEPHKLSAEDPIMFQYISRSRNIPKIMD
jgi:hypothetical protein